MALAAAMTAAAAEGDGGRAGEGKSRGAGLRAGSRIGDDDDTAAAAKAAAHVEADPACAEIGRKGQTHGCHLNLDRRGQGRRRLHRHAQRRNRRRHKGLPSLFAVRKSG